MRIQLMKLGPVHMGISRSPRKRFDKFISESSPCYEIIWKVALRSQSFPGYPDSGETSMTKVIFVSYQHNFAAMRENLLFTLYKICVTVGNFTRQAGNRDTFCPYEQPLFLLPDVIITLRLLLLLCLKNECHSNALCAWMPQAAFLHGCMENGDVYSYMHGCETTRP